MDDFVAASAVGLLDIVLIQTGRLLVRLASFGRWRAESLREKESRIHAAAGALSFRHDGRRVVTTTGSLFVGVAFYVLLGIMIYLYVAGL